MIYLKAPDQLKVVIDFVQKMETTGINPKLNIFGFDHSGFPRTLLRAWKPPDYFKL